MKEETLQDAADIKKPRFFSYDGRINRAKYIWTTLLISVVGGFVCGCCVGLWEVFSPDTVLSGPDPCLLMFEVVFKIIMCVILSFPVVKRWHDFNLSGGHYFWFIIPVANIIAVIMLLARKGTEGPNQYGPDPLER